MKLLTATVRANLSKSGGGFIFIYIWSNNVKDTTKFEQHIVKKFENKSQKKWDILRDLGNTAYTYINVDIFS